MPTGVCKIRKGWGNEDGVVIHHDNGEKHEIPASRYIEQGYKPPIDRLPACPLPKKRSKMPKGGQGQRGPEYEGSLPLNPD